jgi:hypothetical protein
LGAANSIGLKIQLTFNQRKIALVNHLKTEGVDERISPYKNRGFLQVRINYPQSLDLYDS